MPLAGTQNYSDDAYSWGVGVDLGFGRLGFRV